MLGRLGSQASTARSVPSPIEPEALPATSTVRVLVVEGDATQRASLRKLVMASDYRCAIAASGDEAWALHSTQSTDVIVCDWTVAEPQAAELCRRTRGGGEGPYVYFIALAPASSHDAFTEAAAAGADDFLLKPVRQAELVARLRSANRMLDFRRRRDAQEQRLRLETRSKFEAARADPLTGVSNRKQLTEDLRSALVSDETKRCFALCDVDCFDQYNRRFAERAGDEVLIHVAAALRSALRHGDRLYRYGGDQFLVLLRDEAIAGARIAMDRVRRAVTALAISHPDNPSGVVTLSVGVIDVSSGMSPDAALERANRALSDAKEDGKNHTIHATSVDAGGAAPLDQGIVAVTGPATIAR